LKKSFYSNGKLLITGEYLVLDGAKALALPTKYGQHLVVENGTNNEIQWKSFDFDGSIWFEETISFEVIASKNSLKADTLKSTLTAILHQTFLLQPNFINKSNGYVVKTQLTFPKFWGLGTSSTLINNIAEWSGVDANTLLRNTFGGSGYDIACAQNNTPIVYHLELGKPIVEKVNFKPAFKENLFFVYLNKKQNSRAAIASYYENDNNLSHAIAYINDITRASLNAKTVTIFSSQLEKHESFMSTVLEKKTVKEMLFPDFDGVVKSLGAWGGDFVLVVSEINPTAYFKDKGYETILSYDEMIL